MKINVLPSHIANMIAAGEVVERPASAVKEMIENSIDAGATAITVEIKKGGMTYIRVTDNGCGIEYDQVETAFLRHATSKIKTKEDLASIYTLGFRGEALASIAAVAQIDVFTKTEAQELGTTLSIEGGNVTEKSTAGCPDGTTIVVKNIFFNTPARMKFLKNDATETAYVNDVVNKAIIGNPQIKFKLINNGKVTVQSPGTGKLYDAVFTVFGKEYATNMKEVEYSLEGITVKGFLGNPSISRKDRRHQIFYINGRNILNKTIATALSEACRNTLMVGKFPVAVLNIELNNTLVDVNVHPTKSEVRFSDDKAIYHAVYWAIKNTLSEEKYVPEVSFGQTKVQGNYIVNKIEEEKSLKTNIPEPVKEEYTPTRQAPPSVNSPQKKYESVSLLRDSFVKDTFKEKAKEEAHSYTPVSYKQITEEIKKEEKASKAIDEPKQEPLKEFVAPQPLKEEQATLIQPEKIPFYKYVGQVFDTYIIIECEGKMMLIDQHAAHERLYFEEFLEDYTNKSFQSQVLLIPVVVKLDPIAFQKAVENKEFFEALGFETDIFGDRDLIVRMTPCIMEEHIIIDTITQITELLLKNSAHIKKELYEEALHTMACKRAIKGNHALSEAEAKSLVNRVLALKDINTCPHGRPITVEMSKYQLEKQFKRIV